MRTLRVRGVALEDLHGRKSEGIDLADPDIDDVLKSNDFVATFIRSGDEICLGVLMVKGFRIGKEVRSVIEMAELEDAGKKVMVMARLWICEIHRVTVKTCNQLISGNGLEVICI